jgi:hypothetical protein
MRPNILSGNIRTKDLIPIPLPIKHKATFGSVLDSAELLCAQECTEFEWHVEARQP